ncbi:hypothetical protein VKS41_003504 [Umbelopsis sp. WA50703]
MHSERSTQARTGSPWSVGTKTRSLPPEIDHEGNIEYKLKLVSPTTERLEHLVTQLKWRIAEGGGEAIYEIGVGDDGSLIGLTDHEFQMSMETVHNMASRLEADVSIIRMVELDTDDSRNKRKVVEVLIRRRARNDPQSFMDIRVIVVGAHDAGKSTLLGYLSYGMKDNGRGRSRLNLLRHRHEIETGRTSSISHEIVGYDSAGKLINFSTTNISTWEQICESSSKIVTFLDTCGHPKYLKTTIAGLTGHAPDYACLSIAANAGGLSEMTREHLAIAVMLGVPVFVVLTKIDIATPEQLRLSLASLIALLKAPGHSKIPMIIKNEDDLVVSVSHFAQRGSEVPIFLVSSVTGANMHLLERFFNLLPKPVKNYDQLLEEPAEFQIEEVYEVPDVGVVTGGLLCSGRININSPLEQRTFHLGPDVDGKFTRALVTSIHRHRMPAKYLHCGQAATLALEIADPDWRTSKSMVLLEAPVAESYTEFIADIIVLYHPTGIRVGASGMVHCGSIRQSARVIQVLRTEDSDPTSLVMSPTQGTTMSRSLSSPVESERKKQLITTGQQGTVMFRFLHKPEYLRIGAQVLFIDSGMKCVGKITKLDMSSNSLVR